MKRSIVFKLVCAVLALIMAAGMFAACSGEGNNDGGSGAKEVKGETQTWGRFTLLLPEGMILKGGNMFDENDPSIVTIKDAENELHYLMFNLYDEDTCKSSLESTKSANGGEDFTMEANGVTWTGVFYNTFSYEGFQMYGEVDGQYVLVGGYYYGHEHEITKAVVSSLKVAAE